MLRYSERTWKKWLNPTSNLNRYRVRDYRKIFDSHLPGYQLEVLETAPDQFQLKKNSILPEFLTGEDQEDAVTQIRVIAQKS